MCLTMSKLYPYADLIRARNRYPSPTCRVFDMHEKVSVSRVYLLKFAYDRYFLILFEKYIWYRKSIQPAFALSRFASVRPC